MADNEFTPGGMSEQIVDMTPSLAQHNWPHSAEATPTLILNPSSTLHQRVSLAWHMVREAQSIAEAGEHRPSAELSRSLLCLLSGRLADVERLLSAVGDVTSREPAPSIAA